MKKVILTRTIKLSDGTFGGIATFDNLQWFTVERPWLDNQHGISCIPVGTYTCRWTYFPRAKKFDYMVYNVPNRTGIFIHSANFPKQVEGCIALGRTIGIMDGQRGVFLSTTAIRQFNMALNKKDFTLEIK